VSENSLSERRETADAIRKEIQDLDQVVSRLLKRSVGADLEIHPRLTQADTLVQHLLQMHSASAQDGGLRLEVTAVSDRELLVDSALVGRSLDNLLVNALHYAESRIQVEAVDVDGAVAFHVDDDGPGVAPNIAAQVFAANVSGRQGGNGLGLALVRAVAEAHGGTATHATSPLGGSRFVLTLPTAPPQVALP